MELWKWSLKEVKEPEMKANISGVMVVMKTFFFIFCCCCCLENIFSKKKNDNLQYNVEIFQMQRDNILHLKWFYSEKNPETDVRIFLGKCLKWKTQLDVVGPRIQQKRKNARIFLKSYVLFFLGNKK